MTDNLDELTTGPGFVKRSRKAFVAGALAAAGSFGPAFAIATADGVIGFTAEVVPIAVVSLGIGVAAFFGTYQTPNAI
ncbi:hypothetical protein SEA_GSHELBY23_35 [Microbacterium phage Gshelby23]|nr:hypothetical protein SEA_GSHELBY23_35 [Microbacterium phage Gshelby23]